MGLFMKGKPNLMRCMRATVALAFAMVAIVGIGGQSASAHVQGSEVSWAVHILNDDPDGAGTGAPHYFSAINQIRELMENEIEDRRLRENVRITQSYQDGVIGIDIRNYLGIRQTALFMNPHTGYIAGFSTRDTVYFFSDANNDVAREMENFAAANNMNSYQIHMSGSFDDWYDIVVANHMAAPATFGTLSFTSSASALGGMPGPEYIERFLPQIAQAMLFLTPAYADAARWTLFRDRYGLALTNRNSRATVIDDRARELRAQTVRVNSHFIKANGYPVEVEDCFGKLKNPIYIGPHNGSIADVDDMDRMMRMVMDKPGNGGAGGCAA